MLIFYSDVNNLYSFLESKNIDGLSETLRPVSGSFGNEKNNYGLRKIKALSEGTEKVWVFFGIMTTNAVLISKRKPPDQLQKAA